MEAGRERTEQNKPPCSQPIENIMRDYIIVKAVLIFKNIFLDKSYIMMLLPGGMGQSLYFCIHYWHNGWMLSLQVPMSPLTEKLGSFPYNIWELRLKLETGMSFWPNVSFFIPESIYQDT